MAAKPRKAAQTRLANALAQVKHLAAENALRVEMLETANQIIAIYDERLTRAFGLLQNAADQFEARDAGGTATHLRTEAIKIRCGERGAQVGRSVVPAARQ